MNDQELQFDPLLSSIHPDGTLLTHEESVAMWLYLQHMSDDVVSVLQSPLIDEALRSMKSQFGITEESTERIASLIRMIYFNILTLDQVPQVLVEDCLISQDKISNITGFIRNEILTLKPTSHSSSSQMNIGTANNKYASLLLLDALVKYPRINDQQLTSERIRVKSEKDPVRGTVRHWIRAYRDAVGIKEHTAIERGQFLFQSENAKKLPAEEREKVSILLKALDDGESLSINPDKQEIIFPTFQPSSAQTSVNTTSFSESETVSQQNVPQYREALSHEAVSAQRTLNRTNNIQNITQSKVSNPPQQPQQAQLRDVPQTVNTYPSPMKWYNFAQSALQDTSSTTQQSQKFQENSMRSTNASFSRSAPGIHLDPPIPSAVEQSQNQSQFQFSSKHIMPAEMNAMNAPSPQRNQVSPVAQSSGNQTKKKEVWEVPSSVQNIVDLRDFNEE